MARLRKSDENIVEIPVGVSVNKKGYVYFNTTTYWRSSKDEDHNYADHKKVAIGKVVTSNPEKWKEDRRMYPNNNYFRIFDAGQLPEPPKVSDHVSVGMLAVTAKISSECGLTDILSDIFGSEDTQLLLDLAMYMLSQESAVFQHFPHWGRSHALFSATVRSDSFICGFEKESVSLSKINLFRAKWAAKTIDDGRLYFCYDSTNVNSQAEGVFLVQKGHAKDDPSLNQVNTDYVVRQRDGLPVTFTAFPGSIVDMAEAPEMISFFGDLLGEDKFKEMKQRLSITMVCDRGYISEGNVRQMDAANIGFLLMLRRNMGVTDDILSLHGGAVRSSANYIKELDQYAYTVTGNLFEGDDRTRYFHIVWDSVLERKHRKKLYGAIERKESEIQKIIARKTVVDEEELKRLREWFDIEFIEQGTLQVKKRGRGKGTKGVKAFILTSASRNIQKADSDEQKCGYYILVSSDKMTATEAIDAYSKRDCVEKVFLALKSFLGMDKIGVHYEDSMHSKSLIWFVASILHSQIFSKTESLRTDDRKSYTVPAIIDLMEEISADRNLTSGSFERRYRATKKQKSIMKALHITEADIDKMIGQL